MGVMLFALAALCFCSALGSRIIFPLVLMMALDLNETPERIALLTTAFGIPFAFIQPVLGAVGDQFGKVRIMLICAVVLTISLFIAAYAPTFEIMVGARVIAGAAAGGLVPLSLGTVGDLWPAQTRQIALARVLSGTISGTVVATAGVGILADIIGWRQVFLVVAVVCAISAATAAWTFWGRAGGTGGPVDFAVALARYRLVLANPRAKVCFGAVFVEGIVLHGLMPFTVLLLEPMGETRATFVGFVVAAFAIGGLLYSATVSLTLRIAGQAGLFIGGGGLSALSLTVLGLANAWWVAALCYGALGLGFYMVHNSVQTQATELAPTARGSAMALHAMSFFIGQAIGPIYYGAALASIGTFATCALSALAILSVGVVCARLLTRTDTPAVVGS